MESPTSLIVAKNTIYTSIAGSLVAGSYGLAKGKGRAVSSMYAGFAALNAGIAGMTFFSFREYAVSPFLISILPYEQYARRRREREMAQTAQLSLGPPQQALTWWDVRLYNVPDSFCSGALTGTLLNLWRRGVRGIVPGLALGAIGCTVGQMVANELEVTRLKFVSRRMRTSPPTAPVPVNPAEPQIVHPWLDRIASLLGLQRISTEDYLTKLRKERDTALTRIAILENEERERTWDSLLEESKGSDSSDEA